MEMMRMIPRGRFGRAMQDAMEVQRIHVNTLSEYADLHPEHVRKLIRGTAYPSPDVLTKICKKLSLQFDDMMKLIVADKLETKYGGIPSLLIGQDPEFLRLSPLWERLTTDQRQTVQTMLSSLAAANGPAIRARSKKRAS